MNMFLCRDCAKNDEICRGYDFHFTLSYGPCEGCGETKVCADCHCQ